MTANQVLNILDQVEAAYPGKIKKTKAMVEVWHRNLADQNFADVTKRLDQHIESSAFPPTIYNLKEVKRTEHNKDILTEWDVWEAMASNGPTLEQRDHMRKLLKREESL